MADICQQGSYLLCDLLCDTLHPGSTVAGGEVEVESSPVVCRCMPQNSMACQGLVGKHDTDACLVLK